MENEVKSAPEASEQNASTNDNSNAAPAESKEVQDLDPRVVEIIGKEKIDSAFGQQPKEDEKLSEDKPAENKPAEAPEQKEGENQEEQEEETEIENKTQIPDRKPTRLDRRLAKHYIHNLHLMGENNIPTEEEILADLMKYSQEEKIQAMHFHRMKGKELRGEAPTDELDDEDYEAIQDAEREAIRQEILAEEEEKNIKIDFISFIDQHPELDENKKEFDPVFAQAVGTLWKGGMSIKDAFDIVTSKIQEVREAKEAEERKAKNNSLSGVVSGTGQVPPTDKQLTWDDVAKIQAEDPEGYKRMVKEGKFKHLM